jgi:hypothetical protein
MPKAPITKRRLIRWSLLLLTFTALAAWLDSTRVVWGWLHGEAFYQGRPTSYWERILANWDVLTLDTGADNWLEVTLPNFEVRSILPQKSAPAIHAEGSPGSVRLHGALVIESPKDNWVAIVRRWLTKNGSQLEVNAVEPGLLNGDPQAAPVLRALAEQSVGQVRSLAEYGLRNIESKTTAAELGQSNMPLSEKVMPNPVSAERNNQDQGRAAP